MKMVLVRLLEAAPKARSAARAFISGKRFGPTALALLAMMFVSAEAFAFRIWNEDNDPTLLFTSYENTIQTLPKSGRIAKPTWSDTYWPSREGGAAQRWQVDPKVQPRNPHFYQLYSAYDIAQMSQVHLDLLSPAEKLDIAQGRFDYPTVRREMARTRPDLPKWFGLCHAVAIVATQFAEPREATAQVVFEGGIRKTIRFFPSDLKALLALSADPGITEAIGMGRRCESNSISSDGACWDTHPASFYIALANSIGIAKEPLIIDVDPGAEVWNAVVSSYSAVMRPKPTRSPRAAAGIARGVYVDLTLQHTIGAQPSRAQIGARFRTRVYKFTLELNRYDQIIGGEWISNDRPDSIWFAPPDSPMDSSFPFLRRLMRL